MNVSQSAAEKESIKIYGFDLPTSGRFHLMNGSFFRNDNQKWKRRSSIVLVGKKAKIFISSNARWNRKSSWFLMCPAFVGLETLTGLRLVLISRAVAEKGGSISIVCATRQMREKHCATSGIGESINFKKTIARSGSIVAIAIYNWNRSDLEFPTHVNPCEVFTALDIFTPERAKASITGFGMHWNEIIKRCLDTQNSMINKNILFWSSHCAREILPPERKLRSIHHKHSAPINFSTEFNFASKNN